MAKRLAYSPDVVAVVCCLCLHGQAESDEESKEESGKGAAEEAGEESDAEAGEEARGRAAVPSTSSALARPGKGKKGRGVDGKPKKKKKVSRHPQPYTLHHLSLLWHHHPWGLPNP